jgi:hypothetical protein
MIKFIFIDSYFLGVRNYDIKNITDDPQGVSRETKTKKFIAIGNMKLLLHGTFFNDNSHRNSLPNQSNLVQFRLHCGDRRNIT